MDFGLNGRRALVLASTRGLGRAIANSLAGEGARVMISGRGDVEAAAGEIAAASGGAVSGFACDLHDAEAADRLVDAAVETLGGVDIVVLNGGGPPPGPAIEIADDDWRLWFDRMVGRLIHVAGRCVPAMRAQGWGRVLTVGSSAAVQPIANMALSNSLRAGLIAWNKTMAAEVAADGVTCNVILPGRIHTERVDQLDAAKAKRDGTSPEDVRAASIATIPANRYGRPEEFGDVAAFLCSARASYITGSAVRVDGGMIRAL